MATLSLTVKVPFAGNYAVTSRPQATASELRDQVAAICPSVSAAAAAAEQCVVYRGRVLPDDTTLSDAGVPDGAVVHLMRRPAPARAAAAARNAANPPHPSDDDEASYSVSMWYGQFQHPTDGEAGPVMHVRAVDPHPDDTGEHEFHPFQMYGMGHVHHHHHPDDDDQDDDHDHDDDGDEHDHHDDDQRDDDDHLHDHDHDHHHHHHHHHHEHDHPHSTHTHYFVFGPGAHAQPPPQPQRANGAYQTHVFYVHRRDIVMRYIDAYDVVVYILNAIGFSANPAHQAALLAASIALASQSSEERGNAEYAALQNAWFEAQRAQERITPADAGDDNELPIVPRDMPDDDDMAVAGATAMQTLFPSLASMLRIVADRVESTQPTRLMEESQREQANDFIEQLGSLASTISSTTALLSSLLPVEGREQASRTNEQDAAGQSGTDVTAVQNGRGSSRNSAEQHAEQGNDARMEVDNTPGSSPNVTENRDRSRATTNVHRASEMRTGLTARRTRNAEMRGLRHERLRLNNTPRTHRDRTANADFLLRMLAYYMRSFSTSSVPNGIGPPTTEGLTADSVLDGVYGVGRRPQPADWVLRLLQEVMQSLTPQQFHNVIRGDFSPLNALPIDLWRNIGLHLFGEHLSSEYSDEVTDAFIDTVCDALHRFSHEIEEAHNEAQGDSDDLLTNICAHTMPVFQNRIVELAVLLKCHREDPGFARELLQLITLTWGELSNVLSRLLHVQWSGLLELLRRASYEVGVRVVGERLAVMFPVITNLFSTRAKSVYESFGHDQERRRRPNRRADGDAAGGRTNPELSRRDMRGSADVSRRSEGVEDHSQKELPELVEDEESDWDDDDSEWDEDSEDYSDDDNEESDDYDRESRDEDEPQAAVYKPEHVERFTIPSHIELDDRDLDDLVAELDAEYAPASRTENKPMVVDDSAMDDLDDIARELEQEHSQELSAAAASTEKPKRVAAAGAKRMAGMASTLSSSVSRPSLTPGFGFSRASHPSSVNRTAFSTATSVPRASLSTASVRPRDEFDVVLGREEGARWRRVVREDEAKMHSSVRGPLSRGYQNDQSAVDPLNAQSAVQLALEDARAVAREVQLSDQATEQLMNAVRENGPQYLSEFEKAIRSRLASDPDFNAGRFPAAAARFG